MIEFAATKIIATLGPASSTETIVKKLINAGVNIFRLNLSHGDLPSHASLIKLIRKTSRELKANIGIMSDLPGPKIRLGIIDNGPCKLKRGDIVYFRYGKKFEGNDELPINFHNIHKAVKKGGHIFINDGIVKLTVLKISGSSIKCRVDIGGDIDTGKGVNIPESAYSFPSLTVFDRKCVKFCIKNKVDFIAMSFVRSRSDIKKLKRLIKSERGDQFVIAKIEKPEALDDFDNILSETDGVMLARGDLGIEIPIQRIPSVQKQILSCCNLAGKPVITATQVLDSMVHNPQPTRAEATDAANAVLDGTDALMLSQETAIGKFPIETVKILRKIIIEAEKMNKPYDYLQRSINETPDIADCVARSVVITARDLKIKIIAAPTRSGQTARLISKYRPQARIIALSENFRTRMDLLMTRGVESISLNRQLKLGSMIDQIRETILKNNAAKKGDRIIITSGSPMSRAGETNVMVVETL